MADPIRKAIGTRLVEALGARVYFRVAPQTASYPMVVFHKQSGRRMWQLEAHVQNDLWTVKAISKRAEEAEALDAEIDAALDRVSLPVEGRTTADLRRESDISFAEEKHGEIYHHQGGIYRLYVD